MIGNGGQHFNTLFEMENRFIKVKWKILLYFHELTNFHDWTSLENKWWVVRNGLCWVVGRLFSADDDDMYVC